MKQQGVKVSRVSDLEDGEMKEVSVGQTKILLARVDGKCYALSANCPHYGAPLVEGVLSGTRIVCPWHHACFNATNGLLVEPPAFDELANYPVRIDGDDIYVELGDEPVDRRKPAMGKRDKNDTRVFVILGSGAAGYMAAQTLREDNFTGRVIMVTRESRTPYDRPNLSKDYLQGHAAPEWMPIRSDDFFVKHDIELMLGKEAVCVDAVKKTIEFSDGQMLAYDSLLIATGGMPRRLPFPTKVRKNVFLLRSFSDTDAIIAAGMKGKRTIIIGASFIGMEIASSLKTRGCDVTVVAPDEVPFLKTLGSEIGRLFQQIHEQNGVDFELGTHVKSFAGNGRVDTVILENGKQLEADFVVVGIGVTPATNSLNGIDLHKDGGVITDGHLRIAEDLYAAGDITHFPDWRTGEQTRIEHWRTAMQQGRTAAHNMVGKRLAFTAVPFFWTNQFDARLNYVGHVKDWDRIVFQGDVQKRDFLAFYIKDHRILAVCGMNRDRDIAVWEELIRLNRVPSPERLGRSPSVAWNL